jgi:hypothetical protein
MRVLVVDVGGTHVKVLVTGKKEHREFPSGPTLTAEEMVARVKMIASDWKYDVVSVGYPGPVRHGRPVAEPRHLGRGWTDFDYRKAFGCPVQVINDAAMQALGGYRAARCSFSVSEPVSARRSSSTTSSSRWSSGICRTGTGRSRSASGFTSCRRTGSPNGGVTSMTSSVV